MALILVADDDALVREVIQRTLQPHGHVVGCVASGEAAVEVATTKRPHLVILDRLREGGRAPHQARAKRDFRKPGTPSGVFLSFRTA